MVFVFFPFHSYQSKQICTIGDFFLSLSLCTQDETIWHQNYRTSYLENNMARQFFYSSPILLFSNIFPQKGKIKKNFLSTLVVIQWSFCISLPRETFLYSIFVSFQSLTFSAILPSIYSILQILNRNNKLYIDCAKSSK